MQKGGITLLRLNPQLGLLFGVLGTLYSMPPFPHLELWDNMGIFITYLHFQYGRIYSLGVRLTSATQLLL